MVEDHSGFKLLDDVSGAQYIRTSGASFIDTTANATPLVVNTNALVVSGANVGIGITSPASPLDIQMDGDTAATAAPLYFNAEHTTGSGMTASSGTQTAAHIKYQVEQSGSAKAEGLVIDTSNAALGSGGNKLLTLKASGSAKLTASVEGSGKVNLNFHSGNISGIDNMNLSQGSTSNNPYSFNNDADTGMYSPNGNSVALTAAGISILEVTSSSAWLTHTATSLNIKERSSGPSSTATYGKLYVSGATPCELWFLDDASGHTQIA